MNAIGYVRLSVKDQSRYSLEHQERIIREYCDRYDINLTALFKDNGESSYTFDRADYIAVENFIKKHKGENDYFIIFDHDRFSRNLPEALMKINELQQKFKIKVISTNEEPDIDTSDPSVFMQRAFRYLIANEELFRIRKRTKENMRHAQLSGRYLSGAPFGYINMRDDRGKPILAVDEDKAPIVQKIFRDFLNDVPVFIIHREVRKLGFKNNGNSAIPRVIANCLYGGLVKVTADRKNPDRYVKGLHEALVSESDYWLAQEKLGNKRATKTQPREDFPLRGVLKCWCGKSMTAGFSKGKRKYYLYYRCIEHTETNIPGGMLHEKMDELLSLISFTKAEVEYIINQSRKRVKEAIKEKNKILKEYQRQLIEVNKKIHRLDERLMDEVIDDLTYKKWNQRYKGKQADVLKKIKNAKENKGQEKLEKLERLLPSLTNMKGIFEISNYKDRQTFLKGVFKHNLSWTEGQFRTPYIDETFANKSLIAQEKGLLFVEQPNAVWEGVPYGSP